MPLIAVVGDCTTTTTVALAATSPNDIDPVVVEADRTGGSIAAWLDTPATPSLSTAVTSLRSAGDDDAGGAWSRIDGLIRRSRAGFRFIPAPIRSIEAARAVEEASGVVLPTIARHATAVVDVGRRSAAEGIPAAVRLSETVVVCHRQAPASAAAAGVRLDRVAELVELLSSGPSRIVVAVIGDEPFDPVEIGDHLAAAASPAVVDTHRVAVDDLAAAVIAGRQGVSARRFARLPLIRTCADVAASIGDGRVAAAEGLA